MRCRVAFACLVLGGCDPEAIEGGKPAPGPAPAASAPEVEKDFMVCMAACARGRTMSADERASCHARCEPPRDGPAPSPAATAASEAITTRFDACAAGCGDEALRSDRFTCRLQCAQQASSAGSDHGLSRDERACATACLDAYVGCEADCPPGLDDAATCRLHCDTDRQRCLPRCDPTPEA
jgi:hypothetical protein